MVWDVSRSQEQIVICIARRGDWQTFTVPGPDGKPKTLKRFAVQRFRILRKKITQPAA